jgi:thioredoxin-dependent peroxiredoxin
MASKKKARAAKKTKKAAAKARPAKVAKKAAKAAKAKAPKRAAAKPAPKAAKKSKAPKASAPSKAPAKAKSSAIGEGDRAPSFELEDQNGERLASTALAGEPYVVYFYPKDDTPGCTVEACGFRDSLPNFSARGVRVIGISPDSVGSHARFRDKHGINFTLLSDPEKVLAKAFGVWVKKQNYGREYMGIERSTFVVDPDGVVYKAWKGVKVPGHVDKVLDAVKTLR